MVCVILKNRLKSTLYVNIQPPPNPAMLVLSENIDHKLRERNNRSIIPLILITSLLIGIYGCDVPRNNPFDPWGTNYSPSTTMSEDEYQVSVYSCHENLWYPGEIYRLHIEAEIYLPLPIDSIKAVYQDSICYPLYFYLLGDMSSIWKTEILEDYLPGGEIYSLLGNPFNLEVYFTNGSIRFSSDFWLARVIEYIPQTRSPGAGEITDSYPLLEWELAELNFPFTYTLKVMKNEAGISQLFWSVEGIIDTAASYQVDTPLQDGAHLWTVTVVDDYNNQSTSNEAAFIVYNEPIP